MQCRMARAALGWEQADLGRAAGIEERHVARFEAGERVLPGQVQAMRAALVGRGVEFFDDGAPVGAVRFAPPSPAQETAPQPVLSASPAG